MKRERKRLMRTRLLEYEYGKGTKEGDAYRLLEYECGKGIKEREACPNGGIGVEKGNEKERSVPNYWNSR